MSHNFLLFLDNEYKNNTELSPPNSYVEALTPNVTVVEDGAFKDVIKVKLSHKGRILNQ